jgi:hypothetical protein
MSRKIRILVSSSLLWIGTAGVVACLMVLLTGGNLGPLAFALRFGITDWFPLMFPEIFWASVALAVSGMLLGVVRLCSELKNNTTTS